MAFFIDGISYCEHMLVFQNMTLNIYNTNKHTDCLDFNFSPVNNCSIASYM